jgi:hypothetical protein
MSKTSMVDVKAWISSRFESLKVKEEWHGFWSELAKTLFVNFVQYHQDKLSFKKDGRMIKLTGIIEEASLYLIT